jgi:hypothetical protein
MFGEPSADSHCGGFTVTIRGNSWPPIQPEREANEYLPHRSCLVSCRGPGHQRYPDPSAVEIGKKCKLERKAVERAIRALQAKGYVTATEFRRGYLYGFNEGVLVVKRTTPVYPNGALEPNPDGTFEFVPAGHGAQETEQRQYRNGVAK